jgi:hypothetical protein
VAITQLSLTPFKQLFPIYEACPVYLKETYGILGYDEETKQNVELMEKARGS